jgi:hypothetical protein
VTGAKARIPWAFADAEIGDRPERVPEAQLAVQSLTSIFQSPDLHAGWAETGSPYTQTGSHLPRGSSSGPSNDPRRTDCGAGGTRRRFVAGYAEISRRTGLSRNTVRKYLRSGSEEPKFSIADRPSKLDPYADKLSHMLRQEAGKSRKQKHTIKRLHADLSALGYEGSYNRVAAFARDWKAARQPE